MNIAIFCSGNGSNFQAIVDAKKQGVFKSDIALMVCDSPDAYAIKRAEKESIETFLIDRQKFSSKKEFEGRIIDELESRNTALICLAGYMRILSSDFIKKYKNKILNIHPALLPSFKGAHGIKDAIDHGVKITGVTVHFVTPDMDSGPIILQEPVSIEEGDSEDTLTEKIHNIEHRLYPEAIRLFTEGRLKLIGRKVKILVAAAIFLSVFSFESRAMLNNDMVFMPTLPIPNLFSEKQFNPDLSVPEGIMPKRDLGNNRAQRNLEILDRLELMSFKLYDTREIMNYDSGVSGDLEPNVVAEKPLPEEEIEKIKIESCVKAARALAEVMKSINFNIAYSGINNLANAAKKIVDFRTSVGEKYHLHFKVDEDEAVFRYKKSF